MSPISMAGTLSDRRALLFLQYVHDLKDNQLQQSAGQRKDGREN